MAPIYTNTEWVKSSSMFAPFRHRPWVGTKGLLIIMFGLSLANVGCDEGMTIYQTDADDANTLTQRLTIQVHSARSLIGNKFYAPGATITDRADKPVVVDKVELIADGMSYQNTDIGSRHEYPLTVPPGDAVKLPLWFDLKHSVDVTFKTSAELRLYCRLGKEEFVQSTYIAGGPLDLKK
jgi:hypothetical protein